MRFLISLLFSLLLAAPCFAESMTDHTGKEFYFSKPYTRIISLYAAHSENLFRLGLDKEVIGVTKGEEFPFLASEKPTFSTRDSVEKFLAAKPDLVLIRPMQKRGYPSLWRALEKHGIQVLAYQPATIDEMFDYWRTLGRLSGHELNAENMVAEFKENLEAFSQQLARIPMEERPWVFFESIHRKLATFSPGSMPIFVLEMAGGRNIANDATPRNNTNIANYGLERLLARSARIDIYLAQYGTMNQVNVRSIMDGPAASRIKAVRDRNVFLVDEHLVSRPTMRLLQGIRAVHQLMHPSNGS